MQISIKQFFDNLQNKTLKLLIISAEQNFISVVNYLEEQIKLYNTNNLVINKFDINKQFEWQQFTDYYKTESLFHESKLFIFSFKNKPIKEEQTHLLNFCKTINATDWCLIITDKLDKTDLNSNWIKEINNQNGYLLNINFDTLKPILLKIFQDSNIMLTTEALNCLINNNSANIPALMQEAKRITLFFKPHTNLDIQLINNFSNDNSIYNIYEFSDTYLKGELKQSLHILDKLYTNPEDGILINWIFADDIRKLIKLKEKIKQNISINEAMKMIGIWNTQQNKYQHALNRLNYLQLLKIFTLINQLDFSLKGIDDKNIKQEMQHILTQICLKESQ